MAAQSNAERQRRHRERVKARLATTVPSIRQLLADVLREKEPPKITKRSHYKQTDPDLRAAEILYRSWCDFRDQIGDAVGWDGEDDTEAQKRLDQAVYDVSLALGVRHDVT